MKQLLRALIVACLAAAALITIDLRITPVWTPVRAAVAQDTPTHGSCADSAAPNCTGGGPVVMTVAHTTNASTLRALIVGFTLTGSASCVAPDTVTYAGVSLSAVETVSPAGSRWAGLWALPAGTMPATGANNVVASWSAIPCGGSASQLDMGVFSASGVDQTTNYSDTGTNSGTGTSATLTLTGVGANDPGFQMVCAGNGLTSTTETSQWSVDNTSFSCGSSGGATTANADVSRSWTVPSDSWIMIGGNFKESSGGGGSPGCRMLLLLGVGGTCS